jgi:glycosyltransferase involved in cell wall biosynthesis
MYNMKICFLDKTIFQYNEDDKYSSKLRGAETILINLSIHLKNLGNEVTIYNNCPANSGKNWYNIELSSNDKTIYDVAIANADANLFNTIKAKKKIVISYSLQSIEKFIRKKQLLPYLKHRPTFFLIGKYHKNNRSKLTSLFGSKLLNLSVDDIFLQTQLNEKIIPYQAIFTSRADRNLDLLIDIWKSKIFPKFKKAKLLVTPHKNVDENFNIVNREFNSQQTMIADLLKSRILLVPGHKAELFCLAAEEAKELCLPIVTLGIGSLSERVIHGKTGFIAKNTNEFAEFTLELFNNDNLWQKLRNNLIDLRGKNNWLNSAKDLLNKINQI